MRRSFLAVALFLLAGACYAQRRDGDYKPASGPETKWQINDHQTLIWGGQPYLPIGIRVDGTPQAISAAKAAGISDVIVDLPASGTGWDDALTALNKANMRFLIRVDSLTPMAKGFAIEPQSYRVTGITKTQQVSLEIPGATSAFVVLAMKSDGSIIRSGRVPIVNGQFSYLAEPGAEVEHVLLVYPEMKSIEQPDFWEDLDSERDSLLGSLKRHPPGAGLRGIVNPMGRGLILPGRTPRFVPTSPYFKMEFRDFLEDKYKNVETLMRNWSMASSNLSQGDKQKEFFATFDNFAKLIPLWTESRGIGAMFDPDTNTCYTCDSKHSKAWDDISEVINAAGKRRFNRIVPAIRTVVDVPVIQDWLGWAAPYETKTPIIDGIGMRAAGSTPSKLADSGSRAASTVLRWGTRGWIAATDLDLGNAPDAVAQLPAAIDDLESMGAKGIFVHADTSVMVKAVADEAAKRATDTSPSTSSPLPIFFPENAYNPAVPQRLPGGHWWLPSPSDGNRIDLGTLFFAYRLQLDTQTFVIWARKPGRYKLRLLKPKLAHFQTMDGSSPDPKIAKDSIELNLTEMPMVITGTDEVPVPAFALEETVGRFRAMLTVAQKATHDTDEEQQQFIQAFDGFDRNPGGSFDMLRRMYWALGFKVAKYSWLPGTHSGDTNFSEIVTYPGCVAGGALSLRTLIPPGPSGYYAAYNLPVKSKEDQEIWIAAKIPPERRGDLSVSVGGQIMRLSGEPLSPYGDGFGWYKLGTTRVAGNQSKLRVQVDSPGNAEVAIDTILVIPGHFTPDGVTPPDPLPFRDLQLKSTGGKRRGSGGL